MPGMSAEFDVVAVVGSAPRVYEALEPFLSDDDPDPIVMCQTLAPFTIAKLSHLWQQSAPSTQQAELTDMSKIWVECRCTQPGAVTSTLLRNLRAEFPSATDWLFTNPSIYVEAITTVWELLNWQRTFVLRYLARFFTVQALGSDWSSVGLVHHHA